MAEMVPMAADNKAGGVAPKAIPAHGGIVPGGGFAGNMR
jgi:hypothetical protein